MDTNQPKPQISTPAPTPRPDFDFSESKKEVKKSKKIIIISIVIMALVLGAIITVLVLFLNKPGEENSPSDTSEEPHTSIIPQDSDKVKYYSPLTGVELASESEASAATFCVQIPNGLDGARPQAGLDKAGVIFEAIAEAGITRFAAIFQNVDTIPVIGPMRSLRIYYLEWDAPFDCTIVHDGGSDEATAAARSYKDFTNFGNYVWRSDSNYTLNRLWNNEFTSGPYLINYNNDQGYPATSDVKGFAHLTPAVAAKNRADKLAVNKLDIDTGTDTATSELNFEATNIALSFGGSTDYDPVYTYDAASNTYLRSYASGDAMITYDCSGQSGELTPETACIETRVAPSVVIALRVNESTSWDNYHQDITTIGSGEVTIFQGGEVISGTWVKDSVGSQLNFLDSAGNEIALAPGQVIVSAIPQYGSVSWN